MPRPWTRFYEAMATAMSHLSCSELFERVQSMAANNHALHYLHFEKEDQWRQGEIDPFTTFGIFNRGQTDAHRADLAGQLAKLLGVSLTPPQCFHGIPHLDPRRSIYDGQREIAALFVAALPGDAQSPAFTNAWDAAIAVHGNALATLSMGLFWMRPYAYMALDKLSEPYIAEKYGLEALPEKCSGREYAERMLKLGAVGSDFPDIAFGSWEMKHPGKSC